MHFGKYQSMHARVVDMFVIIVVNFKSINNLNTKQTQKTYVLALLEWGNSYKLKEPNIMRTEQNVYFQPAHPTLSER